MTLFDSGHRDSPGLNAYQRRAEIPEDEWCEPCEGLGTVRWRHSWTGPDYRVCFSCNGSGRKEKKDAGK